MAEEDKPKPQQQPDLTPDIAKLLNLFSHKVAREAKVNQYANNLQFSSTFWDLKINFGQYHADTSEVDWHTAVTLQWQQAKIAAYFLLINLFIHESANGPIRLPAAFKPPKPEPPSEELLQANPALKPLYEFCLRVHADTFGE